MATVQIWNGSTWIDFYTLPNATSSTLGGVKIGNNITVNSGTISLTKSNVTSALGYTPLSLSGGAMTGNLTLYAASDDSPRLTFQRGTLSDTLNDWSLYDSSGYLHIQQRGNESTAWETRAIFNQNGVNFTGTISENGTLLSSKYAAASHNHDSSYLGKTATAADSSKLNGQSASYYAKNSEVVKTSGNQDNIGGDKTFNGQTTIDNLILTTISGAPTINVYNTQNVSGYLVTLPYNNGLDCTIASTGDLSNYQPLDADLTSIAGLSGTSGLLKKTAANTWSLDTNSYSLANHTHTSLKSNTDNRSTDTTPNNYNGVFNIAGLKTNSNIGLNASTYGDYSCVMGVRGWSDSSGGHAHEIALTGNGYLMHRSGATTSWNDWKRIAYTSDIPGIATQSAAGLMSSTDKTKLDGIATGATKVTTDTVSGWGYTKNTGTVTQVKVGTTAYSPSSGVVSLPAYPSIPTSLKNPNSITIKAGNDTVSSYDGSAAKTFTFAASTTAGAFTVSDGNTTKTIQLAGKFTDNNTWRPVVDNLTSTDTDKSLSANQGKVLKGLVDGKAASNHTHSQYLTSHLYRPIQVDGATLLANTIDTALNLKAGTNITLLSNRSTGVITINSTASGGMTCSQIFQGAGDTSGTYRETISSGSYKILLFEIDVNDVNFYLSVPTDDVISGTRYFYLAAGNTNNGAMGIVQIMSTKTNFSASVSNGNIIVWNVNVFAYK